MDATRADIEFTAEICQIAIDEGATTINIPDTVGYTMPDEYTRYLEQLYAHAPGLAGKTNKHPIQAIDGSAHSEMG